MLIIYAHPNKDGHCGYILNQLKEKFNESRIAYTLLDLYEEKYDPILKPQEHYTSGHFEVSPETKKYQELIKNETKFIFIYPTWWNSPPAILKGFFERTFTSRFAFYYEDMIPHGLLQGKALVFTTTGGPAWIEKIFLGSRSLKIVTFDILRFCNIKSKGVIIGSARKLTQRQKNKINFEIKRNLKYISK